ncbi:hypothetical protein Hanom_Chr14g01266211 [Helianthus anomalus]
MHNLFFQNLPESNLAYDEYHLCYESIIASRLYTCIPLVSYVNKLRLLEQLLLYLVYT